MKQLTFYLIALFFGTVLMATKCSKEEVSTCDRIGIVKDYTGLDGCGLIIESKGEKFEPVSLPDGKSINNGDKISFSYTDFDGAGICMVGKMVNITCLEILESKKDQKCDAFKYSYDLQSVQNPPIALNSYNVKNGILTLNISFSGCSDNKDQVLFISKAEMKSYPPQRACVISFKAQACDAYLTADVCFDISELKYETILNLETQDGIKKVRVKP